MTLRIAQQECNWFLQGTTNLGREMELRRLRYFLRIASEGSLGKAARSLGVAQPALGRHVQMLEAELGVKLFDRTSKGMQLTDEGEYLKESLELPIDLVQTALRNVRSIATRVEASLVLGLPPEIAKIIGPRLIARLRRDLPKLSLKVAEADSAMLAGEISRGLVDVALLIGVAPSDKVFHYQIIREPMFLIAPFASELAHLECLAFQDICALPLILPSARAGIRTQLDKASLSVGVELNVALEVDSTELSKEAVTNGMGFAILPLAAVKAEVEVNELVAIPIIDPQLAQVTNWAVRPRWPVPRATYNMVENAVFDEWQAAVSNGDWPAEWLFDVTLLGRALPK